MALTSTDETDLLLPLYRGVSETPRFATFLERLRRRTGARHAVLMLHGERQSQSQGIVVTATSMALQQLRPYRSYSLADLLELDPHLPSSVGMADVRIVRFPLGDGPGGWLLIASDSPCTAAGGALLSSVAPYVQAMLAALGDLERERAVALLSSEGLSRSATGWMLLDSEARIVALEPETARRIARRTGISPQQGERLRGILAGGERRLADAARRFAESACDEPDHAVLLAEPRLDAVLTPVDRNDDTARAFPSATLVAWCRFEGSNHESETRIPALAQLYDLPAREAELAIALADGLSIAEAAARMGLTLETARNYSKRLYAKLDVSGQAQLVRRVLLSGAALA